MQMAVKMALYAGTAVSSVAYLFLKIESLERLLL